MRKLKRLMAIAVLAAVASLSTTGALADGPSEMTGLNNNTGPSEMAGGTNTTGSSSYVLIEGILYLVTQLVA